ncbi:MAG TPA: radical SAM protein [Candidatus Hydrogenedentes bacterium]|nr:radical SAM protein [Candidatus Hydrogenedentota bacterium]
MKIILFNSCFIERSVDPLQRIDPHLRVGVAVIAACLREAGHVVRVVDPQVDKRGIDEVVHEIVQDEPDLVGFSAFTEEIIYASYIAEKIRVICPSAKLIVGGYHASAVPERTLREFPVFDLAVVGEGEQTMLEIVNGVSYENIPGLAWRDTNGTVHLNPSRQEAISLDSLPPPAWDLFDLSSYSFRIPVEPSRTCPFRCAFCFQATFSKTRYKDPVKVVDDVERAVRQLGARQISFGSAGAFPLNRNHGLAVCRELRSRNITIPWLTTTRADVLDRELLMAMRETGCCYISLGIETGDQDILSRCNKGLRLEQAEETIRLIHEVGIESELCFIIGLPGETEESLLKTERFAIAMRPYATLASFAILTPFPGTEIFRMAECGEQGLGLSTQDWRRFSKQSGFALQHSSLTFSQLRRWQARLYLKFYFGSPFKTLRLLRSPAFREGISLRRLINLLRRMF